LTKCPINTKDNKIPMVRAHAIWFYCP